MAVSELVATEEGVSSAREATSLREQGENRDTQTRHQGDCDRGGVTQTRACRGISWLQKFTQTETKANKNNPATIKLCKKEKKKKKGML